ncbi:MAG: hypothetical protein ABFS22_03135 [Pseudomonadota bacterium]
MSARIANDAKLALSPNVVVTPLGEGALLLHLDSKFFHSINLPGWGILQLLEAGTTLQDIMSKCTDWGAREHERAAIENYLDELISNDLVGSFEGKETGQQAQFSGNWEAPTIERHDEPLERIVTSAFDPSVPLAE